MGNVKAGRTGGDHDGRRRGNEANLKRGNDNDENHDDSEEDDNISPPTLVPTDVHDGSLVETTDDENEDDEEQDDGKKSQFRSSVQGGSTTTTLKKGGAGRGSLPSCRDNIKKKKDCWIKVFSQLLIKWTSSSTHTERGIKLLQYLFWLASKLATIRRVRQIRSLSASSGGLRHPPSMVQPPPIEDVLSPGLNKIYLDLSMARYALRLYGFPLSLEAMITGSWGAGSGTRNKWILDKLGQIMSWSMAIYYPLEHVAYFRWVSPKLIKADAEKYTAYSCRCWLVYIIADFVSCIIRLQGFNRDRREVMDDGSSGAVVVEGEEMNDKLKQIDHSIYMTRLQAIRCGLFVLPAVHWSRRDWESRPWLKDGVLNGLMLTEAITSVYQSLCSLWDGRLCATAP